VQVGVAPSATPPGGLQPPDEKAVVVYGTSILHAAASGRGGMVYSSQMERYLGLPVVNLGFSGHGLMQAEIAHLLTQLSPSVYVLDCEYNSMRPMIVIQPVPNDGHSTRGPWPVVIQTVALARPLLCAGPTVCVGSCRSGQVRPGECGVPHL
jgi:hypothetical protein